MDDLIHRTSHTLHLLIEYDPVRHRLDRLRLESPGNQLGVPATSRMRMSSPSDTVLERTDVVDDGTLKRRSLRYVTTTYNFHVLESVMKKRSGMCVIINEHCCVSGAVTVYASHRDQLLLKTIHLLHETLGARSP